MNRTEANCPTNKEVLAAMPTFRAAWLLSGKTAFETQEIVAKLEPSVFKDTLASVASIAEFFGGLAKVAAHVETALTTAVAAQR